MCRCFGKVFHSSRKLNGGRRIGMFHSSRIALLSMIIGLLLIGPNISSTLSAPDPVELEFPIGLYMSYSVYGQSAGAPEPIFAYVVSYNFTRWIDQENYVVEYERTYDNIPYYTTFVDQLSDISVDIPGNPNIRLWRNVTTWEINDMINLSGSIYEVLRIYTNVLHNNQNYHAFLLENNIETADFRNETRISYTLYLGLMTSYRRTAESTDGVTPTVEVSAHIFSTNYFDYYPAIDDSQTTTTTTTSATTSTTTTTSHTSTTGTTSLPGSPLNTFNLDVLLGFGIIVEILVVVFILKRRD
jgi:hypothetical protein